VPALEGVQGAFDGVEVRFHDMGVDFGGLDIGVAHELLNHPDIGAAFKQMRGKTVAQGMAAGFLVDVGERQCPFDRLLKAGFQNMMTPCFSGDLGSDQVNLLT
jgi:hypothetical protein